jgi:hypothetical protein
MEIDLILDIYALRGMAWGYWEVPTTKPARATVKTGLNRGLTKNTHEIVGNLTTRRGQRHARGGDKLKERA